MLQTIHFSKWWKLRRCFLLYAVYNLILLWRVSCTFYWVCYHPWSITGWWSDVLFLWCLCMLLLQGFSYLIQHKMALPFIGDQFWIGFSSQSWQTWILRSKLNKEKLKMDAILHSLNKSEKPMSLYWVLQAILAIRGMFMSVQILKTVTILERGTGNKIRSQLKYLGN